MLGGDHRSDFFVHLAVKAPVRMENPGPAFPVGLSRHPDPFLLAALVDDAALLGLGPFKEFLQPSPCAMRMQALKSGQRRPVGVLPDDRRATWNGLLNAVDVRSMLMLPWAEDRPLSGAHWAAWRMP